MIGLRFEQTTGVEGQRIWHVLDETQSPPDQYLGYLDSKRGFASLKAFITREQLQSIADFIKEQTT